ncbi:hypothetical protein LJK87_37365 [Paenibacillus sp. P25]|nr:hypothetical protein LJK87_37365 [Paenibacillus sp. P25]
MATSIPVSNLKIGEKISENVITKYNNVLFHKGRIINERDVDILRAFMIASVQIETKSEPEAAPEAAIEVPDTGKKPFYDHYDRMLKLLRQVFNNANARGQNPPILEIRTTLEDLIRHIDQYNILTFSPRNFQINDFIYHNSIMVALTSYILAKWSGMPSKDLLPVAMGGTAA